MNLVPVRIVDVGGDTDAVFKEFVKSAPELLINLDDYSVDSDTIGSGGFADVFKAKKKGKRRKVYALKKIREERLADDHFRRYITELETMVQCRGPYFVTLTGFTDKPPYCITTEFLPKGSLSRFVRGKADAQLSPTQLAIIAYGTALGLRHMHEMNIIHRDIKCSNVLLDDKLYPHICDFGVARFDTGDQYKSLCIGTTTYMAPEIMMDHAYTSKADMYSFGVMLYEMAEQRKFLRCRELQEVYDRIVVNKEKPTFERASPAMQKLILGLMEFDPSKRTTARDVVSMFKQNTKEFFPGTSEQAVRDYDHWAHDSLKKQMEKAEKRRLRALKDKSSTYVFHEFRRHPNKDDPGPLGARRREEPGRSTIDRKSRDNMQIILNPGHPAFKVMVDLFANKLEPDEFLVHKRVFVSVFDAGKNVNIMALLMLVAGKMTKRNPYFIEMLEGDGFYQKIPITTKTLRVALDLLADVFARLEVSLDSGYCRKFEEVLALSPEKGIMLVDILRSSQTATATPDAVFKLVYGLIESARDELLQHPLFWRLVQALIEVGGKCREFVNQNIKSFTSGIARVLSKSQKPEALMEALEFIRVFSVPVAEIPQSSLSQCVARDDLYKFVYSLLAKADTKDVAVSDELVSGMLRHADDPDTWTVMAKLADGATSRQYFLKNFSWLAGSPKECMRVIMTLLKGGATDTAALCQSREYADVLKAAAELSEDVEALEAVGVVGMNGFVGADVMDMFSREGLWEAYFNAISSTSDLNARLYSTRFLKKFAQVEYLPEFDTYANMLIDMFQVSELVIPALDTLMEMSAHPACATLLLNRDMAGYFRDYFLTDAVFEPYARPIIANIEAAR